MRRTTSRRILSLLAALVLFATSSCASSASPPDALALAESGDVDLSVFDDATLELIEAEASWTCDAQRMTSADPGAVDRIRDDVLSERGIDDETYAAFVEELALRVELRQAVLTRLFQICA